MVSPAAQSQQSISAFGEAQLNERHFSTGHLLVDLKRRALSSGFIAAAGQGAQVLMNLVTIMVLARLLSPHDFGLVTMVTTVMGFFLVFREAGLSTATVQREGITHAQVSNLFWVNLGVSGSISLLLAASAPAIAWFYREPELVGITLVLATTFILSGATVQHTALLNRQMRFKNIALIRVGSVLFGSSVAIVMALLNCGFWSLVAANLTTAAGAMVLTWLVSGWRPQWFKRHSGTGPLVRFGANLAAGGFIWILARGADSLVVGRFYGPDWVGLYSRAGALLMRPMEQSLTPIEAVFVPTLSRLQAQPERYRRIFLAVYEAIALAGFLLGGLLLALARPLTLVILGAKWEKVTPIFAALSMSVLFYPVSTVSSWLFSSQGRGRDWLLASSISSAVTVCSFLAGLPFGPAAIALSYSVCSVLILLPVMYHIAGRSGPVTTRNLWSGFVRQLPVWGAVCAVTLLARWLTATLSPLLQCLICAPTALLAGLGFICAYSPARRVATSMISALQTFRRGQIQP